MKIKASFHGILSDWVGVRQAEFFLAEGETFADLILEIRKTYGHHIPPQLGRKDGDDFFRALWVMRGKERLSDLTTKLNDGEELNFFLTLAGG